MVETIPTAPTVTAAWATTTTNKLPKPERASHSGVAPLRSGGGAVSGAMGAVQSPTLMAPATVEAEPITG